MSRPPGPPGIYNMGSALPRVMPAARRELAVGVPAFLGFTQCATAIDQATPVRRWSDYPVCFGAKAPGSYLAEAVRGFFENGGTLCYVVGLAGPPDSPDDALKAGLQALDPLEDVDLVAVPDLVRLLQPLVASRPLGEVKTPSIDDTVRLQQRLVDHCERHGGRFALLDAPPYGVSDGGFMAQLSGSRAALYFPWLMVRDLDETSVLAVPPCGHIAGAYTATDRNIGVFKAPANIELQGVLDLSLAPSDADLQLNDIGVNALRVFPGRGIRIWGARTISRDPIWRYVNVRRLFMTVGRWIERNLASLVFEPHDARLWLRISRELNYYLNTLFAAGALKGTTAAEAFFVKCDAETNPASSRDDGIVITEIGLSPSIPNEFVVVRISLAGGGVTLEAAG